MLVREGFDFIAFIVEKSAARSTAYGGMAAKIQADFYYLAFSLYITGRKKKGEGGRRRLKKCREPHLSTRRAAVWPPQL